MHLLPNSGKIIPIMSNNVMNTSICNGLFSKTRQAVLALLYGQAEKSFYTKQVLDAVKMGRGTVQRELQNLTEAGIITREVQGRQVYYQANPQCPIFNELKNIVGVIETVPETPRFPVSSERIAVFCRKNHIKKLALFGSVLRPDFRPESDVDVLVEFDPGHTPGFIRLADIESELSRLFQGRKVDVRTPRDLSRYFRDQVVHEAEVQYDASR